MTTTQVARDYALPYLSILSLALMAAQLVSPDHRWVTPIRQHRVGGKSVGRLINELAEQSTAVPSERLLSYRLDRKFFDATQWYIDPKKGRDDPPPLQVRRQAQLDDLRQELIRYTTVGVDWDGYGGQPARITALLDAFRFLSVLPQQVPVPKPMLTGSGTIGLYWDLGRNYVSLELEGDGTYTYLTDQPGGYGGEEAIAVTVIAPGLDETLRGLIDRR